MALGHKGLGKGLDSLFGGELQAEETHGISRIPIREIEPNPAQPRRDFDEGAMTELAESIRKNGVISPITVRKTDAGYQIVAGERRWRACRQAGVDEIPALVVEVDDQTAFEMAMIENLQREDLNPLEEAEGYKELMERFGLTQEEVAEKVGRSRPAVANVLRLLTLPQALADLVRAGQLSQGHARTLLRLSDVETMLQAAQMVIDQGLSVRQTEKLVKKLEQMRKEKEGPLVVNMNQIYIEELENRLAQATGRKINISQGKEKGKITIEFYGNEDLESLSHAIMGMAKREEPQEQP